VKIPTQVSPAARAALSNADITGAVRRAQREAESQPDWRPGKSQRFPFTKGGDAFVVALDYRATGYVALVARPDELALEAAPDNPEDN
jgi:hypothetical protein